MDKTTKWTDDMLRDEALKYDTLSDFWKYSGSAAQISKRNRGDDFFNQITKHMKEKVVWDKESIKKEALKYKSRSEFHKKSIGAYSAAKRMGILDDVCSHMKLSGNKYNRLIYAYEFPDNSVYVGLTYNMDKRHKSHTTRDTSAVYLYSQKTGLKPIKKEITGYISKSKAQRLEGKILEQYRTDGWVILNRAKTGSLGGADLIWSDDKIMDTFKQYEKLSDVYDNHPSAILAAKRKGKEFYNKVTSHLIRKAERWTDERLRDEALKYNTKQELIKNNRKVYNVAKRRGKEFFDSITSHMKGNKIWSDKNLNDDASKYKTKNEWRIKSGSAYITAKRKGKDFFDKITSHMT